MDIAVFTLSPKKSQARVSIELEIARGSLQRRQSRIGFKLYRSKFVGSRYSLQFGEIVLKQQRGGNEILMKELFDEVCFKSSEATNRFNSVFRDDLDETIEKHVKQTGVGLTCNSVFGSVFFGGWVIYTLFFAQYFTIYIYFLVSSLNSLTRICLSNVFNYSITSVFTVLRVWFQRIMLNVLRV